MTPRPKPIGLLDRFKAAAFVELAKRTSNRGHLEQLVTAAADYVRIGEMLDGATGQRSPVVLLSVRVAELIKQNAELQRRLSAMESDEQGASL